MKKNIKEIVIQNRKITKTAGILYILGIIAGILSISYDIVHNCKFHSGVIND